MKRTRKRKEIKEKKSQERKGKESKEKKKKKNDKIKNIYMHFLSKKTVIHTYTMQSANLAHQEQHVAQVHFYVQTRRIEPVTFC